MIDVERDRFYAALADLGYNFDGPFRALTGLRRKRGKATCAVKVQPSSSLLIHPAELDAMMQSAILAYSYPYDEELRTLHLPTTIRRIRVNPAALQCATAIGVGQGELLAPVDASISLGSGQGVGNGIVANINLYAAAGTACPSAAVQVQGVSFVPLKGLSEEEDRQMYSRIDWIQDRPDGIEASRGLWEEESQREIARLLERIATFYLRKFDREVPLDHPARTTSPTKWYLNHARHVAEIVESGKHKWWRHEWHNDTVESVTEASKHYIHLPDVEIMHLVGNQMPRVFAGETTMLEEFRAGGSDVLDRYYAEGIGLRELARWVGRAVKQITDRYPHMNILEVGAGTGGATKAIFSEIGDSFLSYTYTDISAAFFENASAVFSKQRGKMVFKTLDIERDPAQQEFATGTYDLIVAFFVIHATSDLECSLRNLRKLLRPGGFLVVGEGSETGAGAATSGFIFGTLPGWWVGTDKGRILSPLVSPGEWDHLLRMTGFSGADAAPPISVEDIFNVFPVVSQAIDARISFLREPLDPGFSLERAGASLIERLIIVGGATVRSAHIVRGLRGILGDRFAAETYHFERLTDVDFRIAAARSTVISLTELDSPVFQDITPERFEALKKIMEPGRTMLWVTSGRLCDEPFANMTAAFGRVATHETPDLRLQHLDIPNLAQNSSIIIAETVLRLHAQVSGDNRGDIFWTVEPEIVIDEDGRQLVPRVRFINELNDRYNAGRRPVVHEVDVQSSAVPIILYPSDDGAYILKEAPRCGTELSEHRGDFQDLIEFRTTHTILSALKTPFGHRFLAIGMTSRAESSCLALVSSPGSIIRISQDCVVACAIPNILNGGILRLVAAHLISMEVLDRLCSGQTLIEHNAPRIVADALAVQAAARGINVVSLTDSVDDDDPDSWIKLPEFLGQFELEDILTLSDPPAGFLGLSNHDVERSKNGLTILSNLQSRCHTVETAASLYSRVSTGDSSMVSPAGSLRLQSRLREALSFVQQHLDLEKRPLPAFVQESVRLSSLANGSRPVDPLCVVEWTDHVPLPVHVARLDAGRMFGRSAGTYWIVGMSGALGISLADWMISRGARYLVMTSRKPEIAPEWIASHRRKGATVMVIPCDVTNEAALKDAYQKILDTLPPVAGVIHGAMVLRDTSIRNMTFDQLNDVIRPKVDGSIYLDRIFWDVDLDFFVLTSSINTVIGNLGQANYAASNAFMCSLAAQRRKRGLRAAAVNGGAIIGAGYMEREARRAWDRIAQNNYMMRLSEEDFVQSICEAIEASRLDSPHGPEISTGLNYVPADAPNPPFWSSDPKFSIFITHQREVLERENRTKAGDAAAAASIHDLLRECQSERDIHRVIEHAFADTLRAILQVTTSDEDLMASRSNEIGLDSLVSVNIRSWFLRHLQVGIPVLRIMSNNTMRSLVQLAVETMPPDLTPRWHAPSSAEDAVDGGNGSLSSDADGGIPSSSSVSLTSSMSDIPDTASAADASEAPKTINDADASSTSDITNWEAESRPPPDLLDVPLAADMPPPSMPPKKIVLTGVTGLLGRHLLSYLLDQPTTEKVICLAIRDLPSRLANGELPAPNPRVEYHEGELSATLLGLPPVLAESIFSSADAVIHNGADTSHMKSYSSLRAANVGSTVTLIRSCLPRRIPLHFVSSAGLAILYSRDVFPPVSVTGPGSALPAADGSFGYAGAKWVCERLLERVHEPLRGQWRVCVHRPSTIMREGADARGEKARLDWVNAMLAYARRSRSVPRVHRNRGALDLVKAKSTCEELVRRVVNGDERLERGEMSYVHHVGDLVIPLARLEEISFHEADGEPFRVLAMDEWISRAVADGLHPAVAALVEILDEEGAPDYPRLLRAIPGST
ncbi:Lovastatin nonaketide synthase [Madurella mycetomatis]|nr:Lovastatin nonaketide synthase [Madurella mycetomatis]